MRRFPATSPVGAGLDGGWLALAAILAALLTIGFQSAGADRAEAIRIEPVVWQFDKDYPGAGDDIDLPVHTVYLKTHDITDWMSTYDPSGVNGPEKLKRMVAQYEAQDIDVIAWFVPAAGDVHQQLEMAKLVIDSGVTGLYADIEPYDGFCNLDCSYLAHNLWLPLRAARPDAHLGVIYDPRPEAALQSDAAAWLSVADVALPMCYWESFVDQPPWNDPRGCVRGAWEHLPGLTGGRDIEYVPMLQGDSTPERLAMAVDEAVQIGVSRVSIWRRGVVTPEAWDAIRPYASPLIAPCARKHSDGCLVREASSPYVYQILQGVRYWVPVPESLAALGAGFEDVNVVPDGYLSTIPDTPPDGTVLREADSALIYVMYGGLKVQIPTPDYYHALGLDDASLVTTPAYGSIAGIPERPKDGTWFKELTNGREWIITGGARFRIGSTQTRDILLRSGLMNGNLHVIPENGLQGVPLVPRNGAQVQEMGSDAAWQIAAGTRFPLTGDTSGLRTIGAIEPDVITIPPGGLRQIPTVPRTRTLLIEEHGVQVYQVLGGLKLAIKTPEALEALRLSGEVDPTVRVVADGALAQIPSERPAKGPPES